jgi:hypothetical protein
MQIDGSSDLVLAATASLANLVVNLLPCRCLTKPGWHELEADVANGITKRYLGIFF